MKNFITIKNIILKNKLAFMLTNKVKDVFKQNLSMHTRIDNSPGFYITKK